VKSVHADASALPNRYTQTHQWHFVDLDVNSAPDFKAACFCDGPSPAVDSNGPEDDCVVRKIEQFSAELKNCSLSKEERTLAVMFLLHFMGDVHQPLHAAMGLDDRHKPDAGGNTVCHMQVFRANAERGFADWLAACSGGQGVGRDAAQSRRLGDSSAAGVRESDFREIHCWRADESRYESVSWGVVEFKRFTDLLHNTVLHYNHAVTQGHRLDLIVRYVNRGGTQSLVQLL
jgi:hypothetical protein